MNQKVKSILMGLVASLLSRVPRTLPTTPESLETFIDQILRFGGWPADNASFRNAICTQVLHISADRKYVTYQGFIDAINRSISNQLCFAKMQAYKEANKANENV